jgi:hypothetical protein
MRNIIFVFVFGLSLISCDKAPYDQYYVWENNTDTTLVLYVNPPENPEHPYFPVTASENIWPPMVTVTIEPRSSYTIHGTMTRDYYDKWFSVWIYPASDGDSPYVTGPVKYENEIE